MKNTYVKLLFLGLLVLTFTGIVIVNGTAIKEFLTQVMTTEKNVAPDVCSKGVSSTNFKERIALLNECIDSKDFIYNSNNSVYFFKRGFGYERLKQDDHALNDYLKAIELNPMYGSAYYNAGNIYFARQKYNLASQSYTKAIETNPKDFLAYYNRGQAYKEMAECEKAILDYTKTISLNENYAAAYLNRGFCQKKQKKYQDAWRDYDKSIKVNPNFALAYNNRGYLYYQFKMYDEALADYNKALELNANDADVFGNRSVLYSAMGENELALKDLDKWVELDPTKIAAAYYNRGIIFSQMEHYDVSIQNYEKGIELNPRYTWAYINLGELYLNNENPEFLNPEKSLSLFLKANEISGGKVPYYNGYLASAYAKLGNFSKAIEYQTIGLDMIKEREQSKQIEKYQAALEDYRNDKVHKWD